VPTLYAADSEAGALSERVFRDLPVAGTGSRHKPRADLRGLVMSRLVPLADLCLAELHGHGPAMIGASAGDLFGQARGCAASRHSLRVCESCWCSANSGISGSFRLPAALVGGQELVDDQFAHHQDVLLCTPMKK
jgi:hypothetical protein